MIYATIFFTISGTFFFFIVAAMLYETYYKIKWMIEERERAKNKKKYELIKQHEELEIKLKKEIREREEEIKAMRERRKYEKERTDLLNKNLKGITDQWVDMLAEDEGWEFTEVDGLGYCTDFQMFYVMHDKNAVYFNHLSTAIDFYKKRFKEGNK